MKTFVKYIIWIVVILLGGLANFTGCSDGRNHNNIKALVEIQGALDTSIVKAGKGVKIAIVKNSNGKAFKMEWGDQNQVPSITIKEGDEKWMLSKYKYLAVDITNPMKYDLFVECRPNESKRLECAGQIIRAGTTRTIRAYIFLNTGEYPAYLDEKFIGMNALPGGIIKISTFGPPIDANSIHKLSIVVIDPPENSAILISDIRGEGSINFPTETELSGNYYPFIDEFGQVKTKEWKGKIHSLDELIKSKETEAQEMKANPGPADWNKYGGWLKGPQLKATGFFRTEKVNGKWWLIDPEGRLFWSHGMNEITLGYTTPITGREHYFTNLPDSIQFKDFYSVTSERIPKGYYNYKDYKGSKVKDFGSYAWNLSKKYGVNWKDEYIQLAHSRLRSWGMNTIGNFTDPDFIRMSQTSYTGTLSTNDSRRIEGSEGLWTKFPDPFDKSFIEALKASVKRSEKSVTDPYCIGYFVDNELDWGDDSYLAKAVIQSGKDQPVKRVMCDYLKQKYGTTSELNIKWQTAYKNWEDFMENKQLPYAETEDMKIFTAVVANEYFRIIKENLAKIAPQRLYLGCRFSFFYYPTEDTSRNWVVKIATKYCDVVSFNRYRYTASSLKPADADKPVLIGEWHIGAMDRGMLHFGLRYSENQENRAEMYEYFVKSCLQNPYVVGAHWFEYTDEPVLGRTDGEDFNVGFLDYCDIPYPEMIAASRNIGKSMYEIRLSR